MEPNDEEQIEQGGNNNFKLKGPRGVGHKIKNGVKNVGKNAKQALSMSIKNAVKFILLKAKVIIIPILLVFIIGAAISYVLKTDAADQMTAGVASYYGSYGSNSSSSEISSKEMFEKTGSLILATNEELDDISENYMQELEKRNTSLYNLLNTKNAIGDYKVSDYDYAKDFEISNAYEFMLNAERMNFNRIVWKAISRDGEEEDLELIVDETTKLKYPDTEDEDKDLEYFAKMTAPYLQSYIIPSSIISGIAPTAANSSELANFAFQIIDKAYHRIQINRYTIERITRHRTTERYILPELDIVPKSGDKSVGVYFNTDNPETSDYNESLTGQMVLTLYKKEVPKEEEKTVNAGNGAHLLDESETKAEIKVETETEIETETVYGYSIEEFNGLLDDELRKRYEGSIYTFSIHEDEIGLDPNFEDNIIEEDYVYSIVQASTIKAHIDLTYIQKFYDQAKVDSFESYKTLAIVNQEDFYTHDLTGAKALLGGIQLISDSDLAEWEPVTSGEVSAIPVSFKIGEKITKKYTWEDDLEVADNTSSSRGYTVDDVNSYLATGNLAVPEKQHYVYTSGEEQPEIIEEELEIENVLSSQETAYYQELVDLNELNLIDIINADRDVYESYISDQERYSKNIGYPRAKLKESYYLMRKYLSELTEKLDYDATPEELEKKAKSLTVGIFGDGSSVDYSDLPEGSFGWPVPENKVVSAIFGWSDWYGPVPHNGIDIWSVDANGNPNANFAYNGKIDIVAAQAGEVIEVYDRPDCVDNFDWTDPCGGYYGNHIFIQHENGYVTRYAHLAQGTVAVKVGDKVTAGQYLAKMGTSGTSNGVHLHFEIVHNGVRLDPLYFYEVESYNYNVPYERKVRGDIKMANPYKVTGSKVIED